MEGWEAVGDESRWLRIICSWLSMQVRYCYRWEEDKGGAGVVDGLEVEGLGRCLGILVGFIRLSPLLFLLLRLDNVT